jgi:hypothetical protein
MMMMRMIPQYHQHQHQHQHQQAVISKKQPLVCHLDKVGTLTVDCVVWMTSYQLMVHCIVRWYRLQKSGLVTPFDSAGTCATQLAGVQAQMVTACHISLWNRSVAAVPSSISSSSSSSSSKVVTKKGKKLESKSDNSNGIGNVNGNGATSHNLLWTGRRHTHASLDDMFFESKSMIRLWSMRHTIHAWIADVSFSYSSPLVHHHTTL